VHKHYTLSALTFQSAYSTAIIIGTNLFVGFKHAALKNVCRAVASDIAEYLEILRVVRDIEYSETYKKPKNKTNIPQCTVRLNIAFEVK